MSVTFRPGTFDDSHLVYGIFQQSILDLSQRLGVMAITGGHDACRSSRNRASSSGVPSGQNSTASSIMTSAPAASRRL